MNEDITQEIFINLKKILECNDENAYQIIKRKDLVKIYEEKKKERIEKAIEEATIDLINYIVYKLYKDPYEIWD